MPSKKIASKKTVSAVKKEKIEQPTIPIQTNKSPSNLLIVLLIIVSFFAGYLFFKVKNLEQKGNLQANVQQEQGQEASPLSVDNLKKYAKDLKLNQNKFDTCLDKDQKKDAVTADLNQGSSLGVQGTPGFFINGKFLGGAFPFEYFKEIIDKEIAGTSSTSCADYSADLQKYCGENGDKPFNPVPKNIDLGKVKPNGPEGAKVSLVEFSDFQCPYCVRAYPTVKKILEAYPNDLKFYYKNFPLVSIHPLAQKAAEAALCADDQGKFWDYHDKLFEVQGPL